MDTRLDCYFFLTSARPNKRLLLKPTRYAYAPTNTAGKTISKYMRGLCGANVLITPMYIPSHKIAIARDTVLIPPAILGEPLMKGSEIRISAASIRFGTFDNREIQRPVRGFFSARPPSYLIRSWPPRSHITRYRR